MAALRRNIAVRVGTRGERCVIELENHIVTERGIAGELLDRWGDRLKGTGVERKHGRVAGFDLCVAGPVLGEAKIILKGAAHHTTTVQSTALGTMRSVEHAVGVLEESLTRSESDLEGLRRRLGELEAQLLHPFAYTDKLTTLLQRQQELLMALDLTKSQAAASLAADPVEVANGHGPTALNDGDWSW
ncbi:MAG TPA: hypothetical protein PLX89_00905, partial [Verrucomicrobiota bacterium]|nr:hypothetical protein [Verrucomicrobiota bacterium]